MLHLPHIVCHNISEAYGDWANKIKFIVLLRHPVERAWSHYLHTCRTVYETETFADALALEEQRLSKNSNDWVGYSRDGYYAHQIEYWLSYFDRKQFMFILHEDLSQNAQGILQDTFRFIGVEPQTPIDITFRTNTASQPRNRFLMYLLSHPPEQVQFVTQTVFSVQRRQQIRSFLRKLLSKPYKDKPNP